MNQEGFGKIHPPLGLRTPAFKNVGTPPEALVRVLKIRSARPQLRVDGVELPGNHAELCHDFKKATN